MLEIATSGCNFSRKLILSNAQSMRLWTNRSAYLRRIIEELSEGLKMSKLILGCLIVFGIFGTKNAVAEGELLDYTVRKLNADASVNLAQEYKGKVLLVVNTASKCGFTGQYEGLEALHAKYSDQGFAVLGFPSLDFGGQEYRDESAVADFCRTTYGVQFPMFATARVKGDSADPFWKHLIAESGTSPKWNFYKYLIGRDGKVINSYASFTGPESSSVVRQIEKALAVDTPAS